MSDDEIMDVVINGCDTLDITRVHEQRNGEWVATTIFSSDAALLRVVKSVIEAGSTAQGGGG